jgi:hypothetical protein
MERDRRHREGSSVPQYVPGMNLAQCLFHLVILIPAPDEIPAKSSCGSLTRPHFFVH